MYRIKDWDDRFENHETKKLKNLKWVPVPNKLDGFGICELLDHIRGVAHLGTWVALLEIASKDPVKRGDLSLSGRDGREGHTPKTISRILRCDVALIDEAIGRLLQIGWLEEVMESPGDSGRFREIPPESAAELNRIELNRIEEKRGKLETLGDDDLDKPQPAKTTPEQEWSLERCETWAKRLSAYVSINAKNFQIYKDLVNSFGLERICTVAKNTRGQWTWPNEFVAIVTEAEAARVKSESEEAATADNPIVARAIEIVKARGWKACVDETEIPGVTSEAEAIAECRSYFGFAKALVAWVDGKTHD